MFRALFFSAGPVWQRLALGAMVTLSVTHPVNVSRAQLPDEEPSSEIVAVEGEALSDILQSVQDGSLSLVDAIDEILRRPDLTVNVEGAALRTLLLGPAPEGMDRDSVIGEKVYERAVIELEAGSSASALWLKKIAEALIPVDHVQRKKIDDLFQAIDAAEHLLATGDLAGMQALVQATAGERERQLVGIRLGRALEKEALQKRDHGQFGAVLSTLAQIDSVRRGESVRKLATVAIQQLRESGICGAMDAGAEECPLDEPAVANLVAELAKVDFGIRETLVAINAQRVILAVRQENSEAATLRFEQVMKLRNDPNVENDQLRLQVALEAKGERSRSFAKGRVSELQRSGKLSFRNKIRLMIAGYYGSFLPVALLGCASLLLISGSILIFRPQWLGGSVNVPGVRLPRRDKKPGPGYLEPSGAQDEYGKLLELFGLEDTATEKDIKHAYREAIKIFHPDHFEKESAEAAVAADKFRRLHEAHDRILEIRRSWFAGRRR